jgi:hypothetical protein
VYNYFVVKQSNALHRRLNRNRKGETYVLSSGLYDRRRFPGVEFDQGISIEASRVHVNGEGNAIDDSGIKLGLLFPKTNVDQAKAAPTVAAK